MPYGKWSVVDAASQAEQRSRGVGQTVRDSAIVRSGSGQLSMTDNGTIGYRCCSNDAVARRSCGESKMQCGFRSPCTLERRWSSWPSGFVAITVVGDIHSSINVPKVVPYRSMPEAAGTRHVSVD